MVNAFPGCRLVAALTALITVLCGPLQAQLSDVTQPGDPIVPTSNTSPGSEGVANAIDNQSTKYANFDVLNTGFTVSPRSGLTMVQCLALTSANDAPERDPGSFLLSGSYDGVNFTVIASNAVPAFTARFQRVVIGFENETPYLTYRLIFPTVANAVAANAMQISEVELLGFEAPTDVTQPGDSIVPTSNNSPGSEGVANAIDNQPTKYLNFDELNTGFTVTPSIGDTRVSGITLTSANDAPERDPASYRLEGSLDGTTFFEISSGSVPSFPTRFYKRYIFFPNSYAFRVYRVIFPTVANASLANSMQISEVEFLGVRASLPEDVTEPGDPIIPTANNSPGVENVTNAIDNRPETKYLAFDKLNAGFTVYPRVGLTVLSGLTLTSANDAPERDPASFILFGAYDSTNLTEIASGNLAAFTGRMQKQTILFENKMPYLQYKLIFPTLSNAAVAVAMQIAEAELLGVPGPHDVSSPGDPIVAIPSNNVPGTEAVANAIDDGPFKYLNFDKFNTGFRITPAAMSASIVVGLSLTSANDHPERDPASYILEGSNDTTNFVSISSGALPSFPTRFHKNYVFFPDNTKPFTTYRLIFPTVADAVLANSMQLAEVEFLGTRLDLIGLTNCAPGTLIQRQPADTPVLLLANAIFRVGLTGPWRLQWYRNGVPILGATSSTYVAPTASAGDDGALYHVRVTGRDCYEDSDEAMLSIFTPSATESIGLNFVGQGGASGPFYMLPWDITGLHPQAYWNNISGASNSLANPLNSSNQLHPTITVQWATSGEWRAGVGDDDATTRLFEGLATSFATNEAAARTVTFSNVPPGNHSLLLYTVQIPLEFFAMDFQAITFRADGAVKSIQQRFIRPQNGGEYNASPGFHLVTSDTPATRPVGNTLRFDNLQPGDGRIQIRFFSPDRAQPPPPAEPIRGPGLNGLQLLLDPAGVRTRIRSVLYSEGSASVSFATISGLSYTVEYTGDVNEPVTWTPLLPAVTGTGSPATVVDSSPDPDMRLYRVRIE